MLARQAFAAASAIVIAAALTGCPAERPRASKKPTPSPSCPARDPLTGYKLQSIECNHIAADSLRRPLHFPRLRAGAACPITRRRNVRTEPGRYGVRLLPGPGPVYPQLVMEYDGNGAVRYTSNGPKVDGWWVMKTGWWIDPREAGEALVQARRLDGTSPMLASNGPTVGKTLVTINEGNGAAEYSDENLFLKADDVPNIINGWRSYPGATAIRGGGCYGFQIDGKTFSYTVVFKAVP